LKYHNSISEDVKIIDEVKKCEIYNLSKDFLSSTTTTDTTSSENSKESELTFPDESSDDIQEEKVSLASSLEDEFEGSELLIDDYIFDDEYSICYNKNQIDMKNYQTSENVICSDFQKDFVSISSLLLPKSIKHFGNTDFSLSSPEFFAIRVFRSRINSCIKQAYQAYENHNEYYIIRTVIGELRAARDDFLIRERIQQNIRIPIILLLLKRLETFTCVLIRFFFAYFKYLYIYCHADMCMCSLFLFLRFAPIGQTMFGEIL
jgi:hypothetical protein